MRSIFSYYKIPQFQLWRLDAEWVCMSDLPAITIGEVVRNEFSHVEHPDFFNALGSVIPSAFIGGFRDRNLRNVLFDKSHGVCYHIDYASALQERLSDRLLRPHRFLAYLNGRLLIDMLEKIEGLGFAFPNSGYKEFESGMRKEVDRLSTFKPPLHLADTVFRKMNLLYTHRLLCDFDPVWRKALRRMKRKYLMRLSEDWRMKLIRQLD